VSRPSTKETLARDAEILRLMEEEELSQRSVAKRLGLSESTVSRAWRREMRRRDQAVEDSDEDVDVEIES
jgi:DNA-directed RNA polymerase specialized sigma subunit